MINLKKDLNKMIIAGKISSSVLEMIKEYIKPGITTGKINDICEEFIYKKNAKSAILNYNGFPKSICTSVNNVVCHGIPSYKEILKNGDIINIDISVIKNGFYSDTSKMFIVGETSLIAKKLCNISKKSLYLAIKSIKPGFKIKNIGKIIQKFVEKNGFSVVKDYCGHGIGKNFHEKPYILHYYSNSYNKNEILKPGMAITIEPMINIGSYKVRTSKDKWTVKTKDNSLSAQYEHTLVITNKKCIITTIRNNEIINY